MEAVSPLGPERRRLLLDDVIVAGAPAQRRHAEALVRRLSDATDDPSVTDEAMLLLDAFRNDPYVWR